MGLSVENLCGLLIRSRLQPAEAVKGLYQRWQTASKKSTSLREFTRWLVANNHLTEYQAMLLQEGYADNFFLGPYRILDRVGKGRMAGVYKAVHESGQSVAIKVLPPSRAKDPQVLARFHREAKLATQLAHPSVVRTYQYGESGGLHYIVMEFLEGETLEQYLQERGKLPYREAVRLGFLAALGLQHIHEKGMIHRDLKPGNLMLAPAPKENTLRSMVKVLDIGLGRMLFDPKSKTTDEDLTGEGVILGTMNYMAPEQARDARRADIRSDLYSLGCTLYHALAGVPPFPDSNPVRQILRHATEQVRPLKESNPDVPEGLSAIIMGMLAKDPSQRYPTPSKAAEALRQFLAGDAEPVKKEESVEMQSYLDWLQKAGAAASASPPVAKAAPFPLPAGSATPATAVAQPPPSAKRINMMKLIKRRQREKHPTPAKDKQVPQGIPVGRSSGSGTRPAAASIALASGEINVEPVTVPDLVLAFCRFKSRDLFMFTLGALSVLGVVGLLWVVMTFLRNGDGTG